jgi:hypothetical protein
MNKIINEAKEVKYWIHIGIISVFALGVLQLATGGEMLTVRNVILSIPLLGIGDIMAESLVYR